MAMRMKVILYYGHIDEGDSCIITQCVKVILVYYDHMNEGKRSHQNKNNGES